MSSPSSHPESDDAGGATPEQFVRIERMLGPAGLRRLRQSHVTVVGLGAVGSYATEALARAGVGHLRLVDFDEVRSSNINRQLYAMHSTVGRAKVDVATARVRDIHPHCAVEGVIAFVHTDTLPRVLCEPVDLVIDAIDSLTPKIELIAAAQAKGIKIVSSMGAALRTDPTAIRIGPMEEVHHCPLAAKIRKRLRKRGVGLDFPCVYSVEPTAELPEEAVDRTGAHVEELLERGRKRRTLGSLPTLTGIFGLMAANTALKMLLGDAFPGAGL